jgi:hypothetical protein
MRGGSLVEREWPGSKVSRGSTTRKQAPPLLAWLWAGAFAALTVAAFCYAAGRVEIPQSQAYLEFNHRRVSDFAAPPEGNELRVVMLGNSRLKYATLAEEQLASLAADLGYGRMRFFRLVNNWAVFEDFAALGDAILAARPHVVVIQLDLLAQERAEGAQALFLREYVAWLMFGRGPWNPGDLDQTELQYGTPCVTGRSPNALEQRKRRVRRWLRTRSDGPSALLAGAFVARAAAQEAVVVLLPVPRTSSMEASVRSGNDEMLAVANRLIAGQPAIHLLAPGRPTDRQYCDLVHMAEPARRGFSAWLVGALAARALP